MISLDEAIAAAREAAADMAVRESFYGVAKLIRTGEEAWTASAIDSFAADYREALAKAQQWKQLAEDQPAAMRRELAAKDAEIDRLKAAAEKWLNDRHLSDDTLTALADIEELTPPDVPLGEHLRRCVAAWDRECERESSPLADADADAIMAEARETASCVADHFTPRCRVFAQSLRENGDTITAACVNAAIASVLKHVTAAREERDQWKERAEKAEAELAALKADDSWKAGLRRLGESLKNMQPMTEEDWTLVKEYRDRVDSLKKERDELRQQLAAKPARVASEAKLSPQSALRLLHAADNDVKSIEREAQNVSWFLRTLIDWPDSLPARYSIAKPLEVGEEVLYCNKPCTIRAIHDVVAWVELDDGVMTAYRLADLRRPNEDGESVEPIEEADDE